MKKQKNTIAVQSIGIDYSVTVDMIASGGKSAYTIVYSVDEGSVTRDAALNLQQFLEKITGACLSVIRDDGLIWGEEKRYISVGDTTVLKQSGIDADVVYSSYNVDGFFMKTKGKSLFLKGANVRGTMYAVWDFLEVATGLRFVCYDYTYIPNIDKLPLYACDRVQIPAFAYRSIGNRMTNSNHVVPHFPMRMRFTGHGTKLGKDFGGSVGIYQCWCHSTLKFVPPGQKSDEKALVNTHPDFFSYFPDGRPADVCLTNGITEDGEIDGSMQTSAIKTAVENLKIFAKDAPESDDYFMFGQEDNPHYCRCDKCKAAEGKYGRSGMAIRFANIMADELQRYSDAELDGRKLNVVIFAYTYSQMAPPKDKDGQINATCKPRDNVFIRIASLQSNYYFSLTDPRQYPHARDMWASWEGIHDKFMFWGYTEYFRDFMVYYNTQGCWRALFNECNDRGVYYMMMESG